MTGSRDITLRAHAWIRPVLAPGVTVVDATAGTGQDTRFLAEGVGRDGTVHAFDIQATALDRARERLQRARLDDRVRWHQAGHERLREIVGDTAVAAVMFNLGWLPGGPREVVTQPATTLDALDQAAALLVAGGRLSVVAYRGHGGGPEEQAVVDAWVQSDAHDLAVMPVEVGSAHPAAPVFYGLVARDRPPA